MWRASILFLIILLNGCRIQNNFRDKPESRQKKPSFVGTYSIDKTSSTASYINGVIFQRIPINAAHEVGNAIESFTAATYLSIIVPADNFRRIDNDRFELRFEGETDLKGDSISLGLSISW